jgi:hypothetical protein
MFMTGAQNSERVLYMYATPALAGKLYSIDEAAKLMDDVKIARVKMLGQEQVTVINEAAEAYQIRLPDGRTDWIRSDLLESKSLAEQDASGKN